MALQLKKKTAAPALDFFSPDSEIVSHGGGFDLPEGDYIWTELQTMLFDGWDGKQEPRLGVMITLAPKDNPEAPIMMASGEQHEGRIFYSMGTKANLNFAPDEAGTGIMPIPGGSGKITGSSNWMVLTKSLMDSGLAKGIVTNDVSVLAGVWVHMQNIPEPKERASFQSQTGDAATEGKKFTRNIAVVTEILDGGEPWEGGGGIPEAKPAAKKGLVKVPPKVKKEPEPEVDEAGEIDEDTLAAASGALAEILAKAPKTGTPKASLKVNAAKYLTKNYGDDVMQLVVSQLYEDDDMLGQLLDSLDFKLDKLMVKPK